VFILVCQLAFAAAAVQACKGVGWVARERITRDQFMRFVPLVLGFLGTLFSNIKVLQVRTPSLAAAAGTAGRPPQRSRALAGDSADRPVLRMLIPPPTGRRLLGWLHHCMPPEAPLTS
jgi:hypothetical protein